MVDILSQKTEVFSKGVITPLHFKTKWSRDFAAETKSGIMLLIFGGDSLGHGSLQCQNLVKFESAILEILQLTFWGILPNIKIIFKLWIGEWD